MVIEPRQDRQFSLADLIAGGDGLPTGKRWLAYALHLEQEVEITGEELLALAYFSPSVAQSPSAGSEPPDAAIVKSLVDKFLLFDLDALPTQESTRDQSLRSLPWWPLAGIAHQFSRWQGVDSGELAGRVGLSRPQTCWRASDRRRRPCLRTRRLHNGCACQGRSDPPLTS